MPFINIGSSEIKLNILNDIAILWSFFASNVQPPLIFFSFDNYIIFKTFNICTTVSKPSTIALNLSLSLYLSSPNPFIIIIPSEQDAAIDNIGYSSIKAEELLLSMLIFFNFEDFTIILQVLFSTLVIFIKLPFFLKY